MSKDPGYSDSKKDTLESRNRFLQERNETLINKIEYLNQVNDGLHLLLKEQENEYETLNAHDEMLIATVDKLKEQNKKLVEALKFYASEDNWESYGFTNKNVIRLIDIEILNEEGHSMGGKLARQVLKEIGEE